MNPTSTAMAVAFWLGLGFLTFVLLVVGYGTGFWSAPPRNQPCARPPVTGPRNWPNVRGATVRPRSADRFRPLPPSAISR